MTPRSSTFGETRGEILFGSEPRVDGSNPYRLAAHRVVVRSHAPNQDRLSRRGARDVAYRIDGTGGRATRCFRPPAQRAA